MLVFGRSCKRFFFVAGKGFSFEKKNGMRGNSFHESLARVLENGVYRSA